MNNKVLNKRIQRQKILQKNMQTLIKFLFRVNYFLENYGILFIIYDILINSIIK